jgi:hypothetical protein
LVWHTARLRVLFERKHGKAPGKGLRDIAGEERLVNCYTDVDLPLFEAAFRELFPTIGEELNPGWDYGNVALLSPLDLLQRVETNHSTSPNDIESFR